MSQALTSSLGKHPRQPSDHSDQTAGVSLKKRRSDEFNSPQLPSIHYELPSEMIHYIFSFLLPADLGRASCVCWHWRELGSDRVLWKALEDTILFIE